MSAPATERWPSDSLRWATPSTSSTTCDDSSSRSSVRSRVYGGGLRVTTTLDLGLQRAAEEAVALNLPDERDDPAAALVSIDPATGEILAMVGGRDWERSKVNFATGAGGSGRQAGSAFKAFTLAAAIEEGYDLNEFWVGPSTMPIQGCIDPESSDGLWHPVNAEGSGTYSLADATAHSVNTIFAQLIAQLGSRQGGRHGAHPRHQVGAARGLFHHVGVGRGEPTRDDERLRDARCSRCLPGGYAPDRRPAARAPRETFIERREPGPMALPTTRTS